jgi:hypothetical protein
METRIKEILESRLVGTFKVSVVGNRVTISSSEMEADHLWDEINAGSIFGEEASGWMSSNPDTNSVTLPLNKMILK